MTNYSLNATPRTLLGRKVRSLRKTGQIPANIFGKKIKSKAIQVEAKELKTVLKKAGETSLIDLKLEDGKIHPVLVSGYAQNPVTGELQHVDFHEVDLTVKTTAMVPIHTTGESPAVKAGNILVLQKNEIEVEALPADLPDSIQVDISSLAEVGATIHAKDLSVNRSKVTLLAEEEEVIVTIQEPAVEEAPPEPEAPEEAEGTEEKTEETETKPADSSDNSSDKE